MAFKHSYGIWGQGAREIFPNEGIVNAKSPGKGYAECVLRDNREASKEQGD